MVAPTGDAGHRACAHATLARVLLRECRRGQHDGAGTIGDLAAILTPRSRFDHRVGLVVIRKGQRVERPFARLRQRVIFRVAVIEFGNAVEVLSVQPVAAFVLLRQQTESGRPHELAVDIFMPLPCGGVLVLRGHVTWQIFELFHTQHQHAVITTGLDLRHRRQNAERRRRTGAFVAHRGHAPQRRHDLRDHRAQVRLLALQFAKGVAYVDALHLRGVELTLLQRAQCGLAHHVGDVLPLTRPDLGKVALESTQYHHRFSHRVLLCSPFGPSLSKPTRMEKFMRSMTGSSCA